MNRRRGGDTRRNHLRLLVGLAASVLAACGGYGDSSVTASNPSGPSTARGTLRQTPPQLQTMTTAFFAAR